MCTSSHPFKKSFAQLEAACPAMPAGLHSLVESLLSVDPRRRASAAQVLGAAYFRQGPVRTLKVVEGLGQQAQ